MSFIKRHWLHTAVLGVLVCVSLSAFLAWRATRPVETKRVYLMPKPNPERAKILARALRPKRHAYETKMSDRAQIQNTREESSESSSSESFSQDVELDIDVIDGDPMPVRYISATMGTDPRDFEFAVDLFDFVTGEWESRYPGIQFVDLGNAGYDPHTFLGADD